MAAASRRPPIFAAAATMVLMVILALPWTVRGDDGPAKPDEERLIAATLRRFADAYTQLDVNAVVKVWPKADRRVLTRSFESIESQEVYFERCDVEVAGSEATSSCVGWLRYVPKVGKKEPRFFNRRWDFTLQKSAAEWWITTAAVK